MNRKQRQFTDELYDKGSEFHGHGGPFMVIGLRMGLIALSVLDSKGWFGISCTATLHWSPPDSCTLDGIQISSGCTMGKRNLMVKEGDGVSAEFHTVQGKVEIRLRPDMYSEIKSNLEDANHKSEHDVDGLARKIMEMEDEELFCISKK
ncbi:hypothetical protein A3K78_10470 [Candidatus Bathyarchaeota archaeon RBG_13_52_12]|nr:MAG: hypothetical protein A3K78_10470 [Candidatus Bathyarchaeota archaeon RBG_13_52_12]